MRENECESKQKHKKQWQKKRKSIQNKTKNDVLDQHPEISSLVDTNTNKRKLKLVRDHDDDDTDGMAILTR